MAQQVEIAPCDFDKLSGTGRRVAEPGITMSDVPRPQTTKGLVYYKVRKNPKAPNRQLSGLEP